MTTEQCLLCGLVDCATAVKVRDRLRCPLLLSPTKLGQQILRLREEKEKLLDTVWLATSPSQIKKL